MSHSGCALVWHVQPRVVIFPCPTHYRLSSVKCLCSNLHQTIYNRQQLSRIMPFPKCQQAFFLKDSPHGMQHTMVLGIVAASNWLLLQLHTTVNNNINFPCLYFLWLPHFTDYRVLTFSVHTFVATLFTRYKNIACKCSYQLSVLSVVRGQILYTATQALHKVQAPGP